MSTQRLPTPPPSVSALLPVLVVEDDSSFSRLVANALEFRGMTVEQYNSAKPRWLNFASTASAWRSSTSFCWWEQRRVRDRHHPQAAAEVRPPVLIVTGASADHLRSLDRSLVKAVIFKPIDIDLFVSFAFAAHANGVRRTAGPG